MVLLVVFLLETFAWETLLVVLLAVCCLKLLLEKHTCGFTGVFY